MKKEQLYSKIENMEDFYTHLTFYFLVNMILFVINLFSYSGNWWFLYPLCDWGIGVLVHGLFTLTSSKIAVDWEDRIIKEYTKNDKQTEIYNEHM